jgi:dTDP-4-dehydrorhamnose reductase
VEPITTADFTAQAKRPAYSALDCNLIKKHFGIRPKPWRKSLEFTIRRLHKMAADVDGTPIDSALS